MELLNRIEAYLANADVSPSRFGRRAAGDPRLVLDLRAGRRLRRKTECRLDAYLVSCELELAGAQSPSKAPLSLSLPLGKQGIDETELSDVGDSLRIEHAIEMIELMLEDPGMESLSLDRKLFRL